MADPRFLIVRLGALGDIVHAVPVAAALRRAYPNARIDWLVSAKHWEILRLVPVVDRRLVVEVGGGVAAVRSMLGAVSGLRAARYDAAFDLQGLLISAALARASGAARVVGFANSYIRERLARPFYSEVYDPGSRGLYDPDDMRHVVHVNLAMLTRIGLTVVTPEFAIERPRSEVAHSIAERTGGRYALLNPGAAWPNKRWPPARFGAVAAALRDRHGLASVVTWGPGEEDLAGAVVAASNGTAVAAPRTAVADVVALAAGATLMISGDTGPTHIATALGTPIVGIYGPTRPSRNGPWSPDDVVISRDRACRCLYLRRCRAQTMCVAEIGVEEVMAAVERRLATEASRV